MKAGQTSVMGSQTQIVPQGVVDAVFGGARGGNDPLDFYAS